MFNFGITVMVSYFLISFSGIAQTAGYFSQSGKLKTKKQVQSYSLYNYKRSSVTNDGESNKSEQSDIISAADPEYISTGPLTEQGLIFKNAFENRIENNSYTDIMQIKNLGDSVHALQFKLLVNESPDDSTFLIFQDIQKGTDVSDTSWVLDYFVIRDTIKPNGASKDQVYVLLYNLTQYGNLPPGDLNELLKVNYSLADIPDLQNNIKSSFKITNTAASTSLGNPVDITPSRDELKIYAVNENYASGLVFAQDSVYRLEDASYTDTLQLKNLEYKAQAFQFKLLVNKSSDDNVILTFENIHKGADVSSSSWVLDYNVIRGPITGNGGSVDEILVLLYNLNYDNGLPGGNYNDLLEVNYRVADLPALQDSVKSSIRITDALASTFEGFPIDITPSLDVLTVIARNRVGFYGDVNGDGCLDILDLMKIVDHIIGKDSLNADEFERADIAPWITGNHDPDPDGIVNVQDLSLLQNIILTGVFPDGTEINACSYSNISKINGEEYQKVTLYINNNGITVYLNTLVDIRAAQIEFGNVDNDPGNMVIATGLGEGYYKHPKNLLRMLLYDRQGKKVFSTKDKILANIPFHISHPEDITLNELILEDINNQIVMQNQVEIIYGTPPDLPLNYMLYQNYPNPFNPLTTIKYSIPVTSNVVIKVFDILGNEVTSLVNEVEDQGNYSVNLSAKGLASGIYFYRMQAIPTDGQTRNYIQTKKMVILK